MKNLITKIKTFAAEKPILAFVIGLVLINVLLGIGAFAYTSAQNRPAEEETEESEDKTTPTPKKKKSPTPKPTSSDEADEEVDDDDITPTEEPEENEEEPTEAPTASPTPAGAKNINLYGDLFSDDNCNATRDSGEAIVRAQVTVNIFKHPGKEAYTSVKTDSNGHYSYSATIKQDEEIKLQPEAVAPSGYSISPGFTPNIVTFSNSNAQGNVLFPMVPDDKKASCTE